MFIRERFEFKESLEKASSMHFYAQAVAAGCQAASQIAITELFPPPAIALTQPVSRPMLATFNNKKPAEAFPGQKQRAAPISTLLLHCCPAAIIWRIRAVVVDSFKRVRGRWLTPHV